MTEEQWNAGKDHFEGDLTFPASKETLVSACNNMSDVSEDVKTAFANDLPDGTYNSAEEVKASAVK